MSNLLGSFLHLFLQSTLDFWSAVRVVFASGAWVIFVPVFFAMLFRLYMVVINQRYITSLQWTFIRVRVPETNTRTPRAMEEVLSALHGLQKPADLMERYLDGYVQAWLALEIRGARDGVQFILRVPAGNRDMAEAAIYAQYPDAEIDEVDDYAAPYTVELMEKDFDLWGTELTLAKEDAYPIKTYVDFEDEFGEDSNFVDPMAVTTELVSALKAGEELWIQILIRPVFQQDWIEEGMNLALKLAGREPEKKATKLAQAFALLAQAATLVMTLGTLPESEEKKESLQLGALKLTPGETDIVRAIQRNVSKVAYEAKIRVCYVGPLAVFKRRARVPMLYGIFRPFSSLTLNSFRPDVNVNTSRPTYGLVRARQWYRRKRFLRKYKARFFQEKGFVLNVEELATLYHFPVTSVKTPALERARAKKGEAPTNVPLAPEELPLA